MRRRILAITLLIAFGAPLAAPLLAATADPEASLPPCCRSHGAHHCAMMHMMMLAAGGPVLTPPPCPFYPAPATPVRIATATLAAPAGLSLAQLRNPTPLTATSRGPTRSFVPSANLKRGPPAVLA